MAEAKRIMGIKPEASPFARLAEIFAIGSDEEEKTSPRIDYKVNNINCKALSDIGAQVSVLSSKIFDAIHDHTIDLVPTSTKLIMGDGRIVKPLGIARNLEVLISEKCIPTDFFIVVVAAGVAAAVAALVVSTGDVRLLHEIDAFDALQLSTQTLVELVLGLELGTHHHVARVDELRRVLERQRLDGRVDGLHIRQRQVLLQLHVGVHAAERVAATVERHAIALRHEVNSHVTEQVPNGFCHIDWDETVHHVDMLGDLLGRCRTDGLLLDGEGLTCTECFIPLVKFTDVW